jgi:DNA-binding NarL/FixJ family response regulator
MDERAGPIRVAAVNDYELVVEGVAAMLRPFTDRVLVVDRLLVGDEIEQQIDVALYDTYGRVGLAEAALVELSSDPKVRRVAVFSMDLRRDLIDQAKRAGAAGFISKALPASAVVDAIERIHQGEYVEAADDRLMVADEALDWPGREQGLSERESQVLVLCAEGLSNREVAESLYVGIETVRTHMRSVYTKLGVRNRVAAAAYVQRSGAFNRYHPADPSAPSER